MLLADDAVSRLRDAFVRAGYTAAGVETLLGSSAQAALARGETIPAVRQSADGSPLATLVRLFLLQRPVALAEAEGALMLGEAVDGGLLEVDGASVRARVDVRPYDADDATPPGWWIASDLSTGLDGRVRPVAKDHVVGIGGASTTLAQVAVRPRAGRALDLGTGSGVQALHLSRHARAVTATDVLPRALQMARLSARLSGVAVDLRRGNLFEPVQGERFDLVVANPPFVVAPAGGGGGFAYRDSGLPGDEVCRRLVRQAPAHLEEGGFVSLLANWAHRRGEDWRERLAGWLRLTGCDAWAVQREVQDPAEYVGMWLRDAGESAAPSYQRRYDAWLAGLEADGVEAIGAGWITMRASGTQSPVLRLEDWPHPVEQPLGDHVEQWFARQDWLRGRDDDALLRSRLLLAPDVLQETLGRPGAEDPAALVLRQQRGMRRAVQADTVTAGLVGACEGTLTVGALLDAIAQLVDADAGALRRDYPDRVRELVADGLLQPAEAGGGTAGDAHG